jgi:branched-chain amino acid transport system ATP-binding protein
LSRAAEVLDRFALSRVAHSEARELSVADLRLLELARAYATDPRLILLDEVAAGLSRADQDRLSGIVREMNENEGMAVIFVEHVLPIVRAVAQRVLVLHHGKLMTEGSADDVLSSSVVASAYLGGA